MSISIKIPLVDHTHYSTSLRKWFLIAWGIISLSGAAYILYQTFVLGEQLNGSFIFNVITIPGSLVLIGLSVKSSFIKVDSNSIQYKLNYFKPTKSISVNEISAIKVDFTDVKITLKSGVQHIIDFSAAKHSDIGRLKSKLNEIQL